MNEYDAIQAAGGFPWFTGFLVAGAIVASIVFVVLTKLYRVAVRPNEVHIVQSRKDTISYGKGSDRGNAYWAWPEWIPIIGVQVVQLPLSVFDLDLPNYEAYDVGKVPFVVDIKAFFRIKDSNLAAERVESMPELETQLRAILQGTVRKILAFHDIEEIMMERSKFGKMFTEETAANLAEWGVENVKDIELMDVRDSADSKTVSNIMAKKESEIERDSRVIVAANKRDAQMKEIEADREVAISKQEAEQKVGERTAEKDKMVGIANEIAQQEIKEQAKVTAEKDMQVKKVNDVRTAEINRDVRVVQADEQKQVFIVESEGEKQKSIIVAEGQKEAEFLRAAGIKAVGEAEAEAKRLSEMANVTPQIELAKEIGNNDGYQGYLIGIRSLERDQAIGTEAAKALQAAGIKVIANTGNVPDGVNNVLELFTSRGGTHLGSMVEGFAQTEVGNAIVNSLTKSDGSGSKTRKGANGTSA